jgi:hypothetical protein
VTAQQGFNVTFIDPSGTRNGRNWRLCLLSCRTTLALDQEFRGGFHGEDKYRLGFPALRNARVLGDV